MRNGSNGAIQYQNYVAGWRDSSIGDFFTHFPRTSKKVDFALVASLDSDSSTGTLLDNSPDLEFIAGAGRAKPVGNGFVVPTSVLLDSERQIFMDSMRFGFSHTATLPPKPKTAWLVGPRQIDGAKLEKLDSWMTANDCTLALGDGDGDGDGLNFILKARGLVKHFLAYTMSQPQPEIGGEQERKGK